jgi:hypothetical protein
MGTGIFFNYFFHFQKKLTALSPMQEYLAWYFIFLTSFSFPYILQALFKKSNVFYNWRFNLLLVIAPAIFAWKMTFDIRLPLSADNVNNMYWNHILYWPFKLIVVTFLLLIIWKIFDAKEPFYGIRWNHFSLKPYFIMLLIMVPLIAAASTQHDFLAVYPKLKKIDYLLTGTDAGWKKLLYELSYGSDFFTIELFFRGFLVLAFVKWVEKDAILPMALFYCTIHFGKPLGECISSFFGGLILGVVTYHTRSSIGGLIVHLGIAWLMELGGYVGRIAAPNS